MIDSKDKKDKVEAKRRRVTRACDTCRQKKVKCDGKQPCIHCTVYSYNCTYDQPNIRNKKNSGIPVPSYPRIISKNGLISNDDNKNTNNLILFQNMMDLLFPNLKLNVLDDQPLHFNFEKFRKAVQMLQSGGNSNVSLNNIMEYYLESENSNLSFSPANSPTQLSLSNNSFGYREKDRDTHSVTSEDNPVGREIRIDLPPKEKTLQLIYTCWNKACVLFRFYHRPSLLEEIDLLYSLDPFNYTDRQQKFLPFVYSILAVGSLFSRDAYNDHDDNSVLQDDGFKYFLEARKLIDITNVGDIISIQTIIMMILYLQCSARLSTCYSYIGIALRSALKEGLHRNLSIFQSKGNKLDPIEIDTRKRLFFTIYKMDIYINSLLGLPKSLSEDEFDQTLPEELDDENITRIGYKTESQQGKLSSSSCANHHTKLMFIMSHIISELYPIKVKKTSPNQDPTSTPNHMHQKVSKLEYELKKWLDQLPLELKPTDPNDPLISSTVPEKFVLANFYLHLAFLNCQIMLYRPFIHFISHGNESRGSDPRSLIRGRNCIKVARSVVKLANKMIDQNLLVGTYWFSMYTIFFSIACLIYYYHFVHNSHNGVEYNSSTNYAGVLFDDDLNLDMIKKDIEIGKKVLDNLKGNSNASLRIYNILNQLFEQLNRRTATTSKDILEMLSNNLVDPVPNSQVKKTLLTFDSINSFNQTKTDGQTKLFEQNFNSQLDDLERPASELNLPHNSTFDPYPMRPSQSQPVLATRMQQSQPPTPAQSSVQTQIPESTVIPEDIEEASEQPTVSGSVPVPDLGSLGMSVPQLPTNTANMNFNGVSQYTPEIRSGAESATSTGTPQFEQNQEAYLPGVMDKLDTQIFGRILPPYMSGGEDLNFDGLNNLMGDMSDFNFVNFNPKT